MRCCTRAKHRLKMRLAFLLFFSLSLQQFPPPPALRFTGRVFSNGGSAAFPLLPYIIYARRREAALAFTRVPAADAEATRLSGHTRSLRVSHNRSFHSNVCLCALR